MLQVKTIIRLIIGGIMVVLVATIITLSCILGHTYNQLTALRIEQHHLSQTVKQLQDEEIRKSEIIQEKEQLLQDLKQAKNWSEICKIWSKL